MRFETFLDFFVYLNIFFLEFRGMIPIVETSSHENINVENAFFLGNLYSVF